jgi:uncharacterized protein
VGLDRGAGAVKAIEPVWVTPRNYETNNPLSQNWYKPQHWFVMNKEIHRSRILTVIAHPVSDLLKPAYSFGGVPLIQMAKPYVDNWLRGRQSASDFLHSFSVFVLKTNMDAVLAGGEPDSDIDRRAQMFNRHRDNRGIMLIDKDKEDFANVSASMAGVKDLVGQSQEQMSAVSRIPLVKLTGISLSGLNASSEGEIRVYYDLIHSAQGYLLKPVIQTVLDFIQITEFSEIDTDITFDFVELYEMTETEAAQKRLIDAQTGTALIQGQVISASALRPTRTRHTSTWTR